MQQLPAPKRNDYVVSQLSLPPAALATLATLFIRLLCAQHWPGLATVRSA